MPASILPFFKDRQQFHGWLPIDLAARRRLLTGNDELRSTCDCQGGAIGMVRLDTNQILRRLIEYHGSRS